MIKFGIAEMILETLHHSIHDRRNIEIIPYVHQS